MIYGIRESTLRKYLACLYVRGFLTKKETDNALRRLNKRMGRSALRKGMGLPS